MLFLNCYNDTVTVPSKIDCLVSFNLRLDWLGIDFFVAL
ncbi:hypothetical protein ADICYQ_4923 [Cyclobacterium qasimii M12-11B]|uniref:Uncharacterized protein n=1 Tax=Cyclobacterium qasimii M12-11B TaxID=641524 RepID=S7V7P3_9BACT|nr:hypothetical protein ADICYQ_4923 [Cyclobacterium qasimii M12-11B]